MMISEIFTAFVIVIYYQTNFLADIDQGDF